MNQIPESEKKRAANLIWNAARDYTIEPGFRVYDDDGEADLYWNTVIGAMHRHFEWDALEKFYNTLSGNENQELLESLFWIATEEAAYGAEKERGAFAELRVHYAEHELHHLARYGVSEDWQEELARVYLKAHLVHAIREVREENGNDSGNGTPHAAADHRTASDGLTSEKERSVLASLESTAGKTTEEIIGILRETFERNFSYRPDAEERKRGSALSFSFLKRKNGKRRRSADGPVRNLAFGFVEHDSEYTEQSFYRNLYGDEFTNHAIKDDRTMMKYLGFYFGKSEYTLPELKKLQKKYCYDNHADARIFFTRGGQEDPKGDAGPALSFAKRRHEEAAKQEEKNRKAYREHGDFYRVSVRHLTQMIRNSMLMYLGDEVIRARSGQIEVPLIYRALYLDDDRIFRKVQRGDDGRMTVDLVLDSSESQAFRQETVAAQAYMIAVSLTNCGIPVRVWSYRSIDGYTVFSLYRDYEEHDKNEAVFSYFTTGANRDGLGIRVISGEMEKNPAEHRLLIILSDGRPNDAVKMRRTGAAIDYAGDAAAEDTAAEVRRARVNGISVMCVFTGDESALDAVKRIYGRDFAYIRNLEMFADAVGTMIRTSIRTL